MRRIELVVLGLAVVGLAATARPASAVMINLSISGTDAIFLAGRTDVVIPPAGMPWTGPGSHLIRHNLPTPEELTESLPPFILVSAGDIIRVLNPAIGGISFYNGIGDPMYGPEGNGVDGSNLSGLDGISGYKGPQGPLTGVFLTDVPPSSGPAPATLDFTAGGLGTDFASLSPELGQVFYIGDGVTSGGQFQTFVAPAGATRLYLGVPDGFGFVGAPGAYDDNDGAYRVTIGINELPGEEPSDGDVRDDPPPPNETPEPSTLLLGAVGLAGAVATWRRRNRG
jgi:hypothetical protein